MEALTQGILATFSDVNVLIRFSVIYLFVIWISVVLWVIKDITNRSSNILMQVLCVLTVLVFTPLGIFVYLLIRPQRTLFERLYEHEFRHMTDQEEPEEKDVIVEDLVRSQLKKKATKKS